MEKGEGEEANLKNEYFNRSARQCFYEFLMHKFLDIFFFLLIQIVRVLYIFLRP